ncbi:MAG: hypothetical protein SOR79_12655 [Blautia sp.]|uniref:hypothetical protein n=1 Tax=Blautia sp. TaxID=1955243 RepID=UPI002A75E201|nr:hypothetical protein [Blautia sp.]MDY3017975.1 hypothetical protein [Blautia sp.]
MSKAFTSWGDLVIALQNEVSEATEEVIDHSLDALYKNVFHFYSSSEGRYSRQGHLGASPESEFHGGGYVSSGEIRLNTGYTYVPSGRSTQQIYNYAEDGGLLGHGGFWSKTMTVIPGYIHKSFGSRFD